MRTIHQLKSTLPKEGIIKWISVRPEKRSKVIEVERVMVSVDSGLEGDHYSKSGGKRMVTLIQEEHIETMGKFLSKEIDPASLRRNIVVGGINLNALHDTRFKIGEEVILEGTGYCHPCSRMEENLGPGGYNAMRGHGGITGKVITGGEIKIGDIVSIVRK